jgi:hypothetical protein
VEHCNPGDVEHCNPGDLQPWSTATLEHCNPGALQTCNPATLGICNPGINHIFKYKKLHKALIKKTKNDNTN